MADIAFPLAGIIILLIAVVCPPPEDADPPKEHYESGWLCNDDFYRLEAIRKRCPLKGEPVA